MAAELTPIDVTKGKAPDLASVAEEVRRTKRSRLIRADGEDIAIIAPVVKPAPKRRESAHPKTAGRLHYTLEQAFGAVKDDGGPRDFDRMIREAKEERTDRPMQTL